MYKVYEKLELRGIEPFNTLIGSFRYSKDAEIFLDAKTTQFVSLFSFSQKQIKGRKPLIFFCAPDESRGLRAQAIRAEPQTLHFLLFAILHNFQYHRHPTYQVHPRY